MTEVLITGATGLVGSRLLKRFLAAGIECRALVRPGRQIPEGATLVEGDILQPETLQAAVTGVSAIVHLAASFRNGDEAETWQVNLDGTRNLIAATQAHAPQARLLMASTGNVYDPDGARPALEDDETHPTHAYPASKVKAEQQLRASGLTWAILRLPFVYGNGDGHIEAIAPLFARMNRHPAQRMSVAHHEDIAAAFQLALTGAMDGLTVNIADDAPTTVYQLLQLIGETYPPSAEPVSNPWSGIMDTSLARSLGFRPTIPTARQAADEDKL
jgi:nucleoside-diphosphate-sugar epimerase